MTPQRRESSQRRLGGEGSEGGARVAGWNPESNSSFVGESLESSRTHAIPSGINQKSKIPWISTR